MFLINMTGTEVKIEIPVWLRLLTVLVLLSALVGIIYHTSHCEDDQGHCFICLLAISLIITLPVIITIFINLAFFILEPQVNLLLNPFLNGRVIRAPPELTRIVF